MRAWIRTARRVALLGALASIGSLAACGDDDCNHVINDVPSANACLAIAEERGCSTEIVYSVPNDRCKVQKCSDCDGGGQQPTETPLDTVTPSPGA